MRYSNLLLKKLSFVVFVAVSLSACTPFLNETRKSAQTTFDRAETYVDRRQNPRLVKDSSPIRYSNNVWLGSRSFRNSNGDPLPRRYELVTLSANDPMTLQQVSSQISAISGISIKVEPGLSGAEEDSSLDEGQVTGLPGGDFVSRGGGGSTGKIDRMLLSYSGSLKGLLDLVSARFGYSWEYYDNTIHFVLYLTRTFTLHSLPGISTIDSTLNSASESGGGDSSSSGSSAQNTSVKTALGIWDEIKESLEIMLPEDSLVVVSPTSGTVTVSTTSWGMRKAEQFIKEQNKVLTKQISISVQVLSVTHDVQDSYNFDVNAIFDGISASDLTWVVPGVDLNDSGGIGALGATILGRSASNFSNSTFVIEALSKDNNVAIVTNASIVTMNNQPVPVQVLERRGYLESTDVTVEDNVVTVDLNPGTVTTGILFNLLPRVTKSGDILLQYSFSLSELLSLETFSSSGSTLQLPHVVSRDFIQHVKMRSGQTLVLSGFDRTTEAVKRSGIGSPMNFLFGGGSDGKKVREILVVLITPSLI